MPIGALSVAAVYSMDSGQQSVLRDAGMVPFENSCFVWLGVLRYLAPIAIIVVFINSLGLI